MPDTTASPLAAVEARLTAVRAGFGEHGIDALLITSASNRRYLSGFSGSAGTLLITPDEAIIATDFRYWEQSAAQSPNYRLHKTVRRLGDWLPGLLTGLGGKRIGFEASEVSYALYRQLQETVDGMPAGARPQFVPTAGLVEGLRAIKDTGELALLQAAIDCGDAAIMQIMERIQPEWTERQTAWEIERALRERGAEGPSFSPIVAGGPWGALPHAYPRDQRVAEQAVVIDMGARVEGYCSDLTRTITAGKPEPRFEAIYDIVLAAQLTAYEMIEPGMTGEQAHMLAQSVIDAAGYGENFGHGLGHGIGLQVHEAPLLSKSSEDVLQEGMVFSIEPGIYIGGWGGIRIEDLVILENGRCRFLSHAVKRKE